jgi:hypothetical protein
MKTKIASVKSEKNFDTLISKIQESGILSIHQMISVRGGEGEIPTPIILPPPPTSN